MSTNRQPDSKPTVRENGIFRGALKAEQAIKTNTQLKSLIALQQADRSLGALGYLGRTVEATSDSLSLSSGQATILYSLPPGAAATVLTIRDGGGGLVRAIAGETGEGRHHFVWDGTNDQGTAVPDGAYQVTATALDADGNVIEGSLTGLIGVGRRGDHRIRSRGSHGRRCVGRDRRHRRHPRIATRQKRLLQAHTVSILES